MQLEFFPEKRYVDAVDPRTKQVRLAQRAGTKLEGVGLVHSEMQ